MTALELSAVDTLQHPWAYIYGGYLLTFGALGGYALSLWWRWAHRPKADATEEAPR